VRLLLNKVALASGSNLDFDEVIRRTLAALLEMSRFERANVLLLDGTTGELWLHPALAIGTMLAQARHAHSTGYGHRGSRGADRQAVRVGDVRQEPAYIAGYPDTLSEIAVPLRTGDRVIGVLDAQSTRLMRLPRRMNACW